MGSAATPTESVSDSATCAGGRGRMPVYVGGVRQHDETTPVELLWLTPRRTAMLIKLLDGPQVIYSEALLYFARVGLVERNGRGEYALTQPRGRSLAERIRACKPPLTGPQYD